MFLRLINNGFEIEALLFMLSTWNFASFRYAVRGFNLDKFVKTINKVKSLLAPLKKENFKNINFDKYSKEIKRSFKLLADIKGIQKTGAPKILHFLFPKVFVMWDSYIRKYYGFKKGDENDYLNFLKLMQEKFPNVKSLNGRTVTKLIDEHNYKTITMPALKKNKLKRFKNQNAKVKII
jgi:endonuclease III-like uncharacterized protein